MSILIDMQGPLHPTVPVEILSAYRSIYRTAVGNYSPEALSCFFPLTGKHYHDPVQLTGKGVRKALEQTPIPDDALAEYIESSRRLMVVGRCPNGWMPFPSGGEDGFESLAISEILKDGDAWLRDDGKAADTYIRASDGKECRYNTGRSAFFRAIRNVLREVKPVSTVDPRWFDYFVWTNLYCFSPIGGGNADERMKTLQLADCRKLLALQIGYYRPTHILFITDWDGWFDAFADLFPAVKRTGDSVTDNVAGMGSYNGAKMVVSIRPDRTRPTDPDETRFAEDVLSAFRSV